MNSKLLISVVILILILIVIYLIVQKKKETFYQEAEEPRNLHIKNQINVILTAKSIGTRNLFNETGDSELYMNPEYFQHYHKFQNPDNLGVLEKDSYDDSYIKTGFQTSAFFYPHEEDNEEIGTVRRNLKSMANTSSASPQDTGIGTKFVWLVPGGNYSKNALKNIISEKQHFTFLRLPFVLKKNKIIEEINNNTFEIDNLFSYFKVELRVIESGDSSTAKKDYKNNNLPIRQSYDIKTEREETNPEKNLYDTLKDHRSQEDLSLWKQQQDDRKAFFDTDTLNYERKGMWTTGATTGGSKGRSPNGKYHIILWKLNIDALKRRLQDKNSKLRPERYSDKPNQLKKIWFKPINLLPDKPEEFQIYKDVFEDNFREEDYNPNSKKLTESNIKDIKKYGRMILPKDKKFTDFTTIELQQFIYKVPTKFSSFYYEIYNNHVEEGPPHSASDCMSWDLLHPHWFNTNLFAEDIQNFIDYHSNLVNSNRRPTECILSGNKSYEQSFFNSVEDLKKLQTVEEFTNQPNVIEHFSNSCSKQRACKMCKKEYKRKYIKNSNNYLLLEGQNPGIVVKQKPEDLEARSFSNYIMLKGAERTRNDKVFGGKPSAGHAKCKTYRNKTKALNSNSKVNRKWVQSQGQRGRGGWAKCDNNTYATLSMMKKGNINCVRCPSDIMYYESENEITSAQQKAGCANYARLQTTPPPTTRAPTTTPVQTTTTPVRTTTTPVQTTTTPVQTTTTPVQTTTTPVQTTTTPTFELSCDGENSNPMLEFLCNVEKFNELMEEDPSYSQQLKEYYDQTYFDIKPYIEIRYEPDYSNYVHDMGIVKENWIAPIITADKDKFEENAAYFYQNLTAGFIKKK